MAGDWIKMRSELQSHPKVVRILSATQADKFRVIGGLHAVWSVFDTHSTTGELFGYTPDLMDHVIGWPGFSAAMLAVNWLLFDGDQTLALPEFGEHNSKGAKRRAEDQKRKRNDRIGADNEANNCGQIADKMETREREDKREELKSSIEQQAARKTPSRFAEFWEAYPVKKGKADAEAKWKARKLDAIADTIIADVKQRITGDRQWLEGFAPHGSTYVNGRGWEDAIEAPRGAGSNGSTPSYMVGAL